MYLQCLKPNPVRDGQPTAVNLFFARVTPPAFNPIQLTPPPSLLLPSHLPSLFHFAFNFQLSTSNSLISITTTLLATILS
ncbi:hypothetical protein RIF29_33588 [Crotalaria pallida]|uniref:Uncharacterized protein n=1 Tax=Crotalaria pallida TaxID=3830 RepID=A0AAN9E8A0_CROPI